MLIPDVHALVWCYRNVAVVHYSGCTKVIAMKGIILEAIVRYVSLILASWVARGHNSKSSFNSRPR